MIGWGYAGQTICIKCGLTNSLYSCISSNCSSNKPFLMNKTRLEAFSDNVFAIAVTLLILNVKLPDAGKETDHQLGHVLVRILPTVATFGFSFLVISMFWVAHHRIFSFVKVVNNTLLWLNVIYLLFVALIPFPASLIAQNPLLPISIILYSGALLIISIMQLIILTYLLRNEDLKHDALNEETHKSVKRLAIVGLAGYILAAAFSHINGYISFGIIIAIMLFYIIFPARNSKLNDQIKEANMQSSDREK